MALQEMVFESAHVCRFVTTVRKIAFPSFAPFMRPLDVFSEFARRQELLSAFREQTRVGRLFAHFFRLPLPSSSLVTIDDMRANGDRTLADESAVLSRTPKTLSSSFAVRPTDVSPLSAGVVDDANVVSLQEMQT